MKEGGAADHGALALEGVTAGRKGVFEGDERGEMRIDHRIVGELPEVFGGLELGGVRGSTGASRRNESPQGSAPAD